MFWWMFYFHMKNKQINLLFSLDKMENLIPPVPQTSQIQDHRRTWRGGQMGLADTWQRLRSVAHLNAVTPCLHTDGQKQEKKSSLWVPQNLLERNNLAKTCVRCSSRKDFFSSLYSWRWYDGKETPFLRHKEDYLITENFNEFSHPMSQSLAYKHQMIS